MQNSITIWMMELLDLAKSKKVKVSYNFRDWENYYRKGLTPEEALSDSL